MKPDQKRSKLLNQSFKEKEDGDTAGIFAVYFRLQRIIKCIRIGQLRIDKPLRPREKWFFVQFHTKQLCMNTAKSVKLHHVLAGIIAAIDKAFIVVSIVM